MEPFDEFGFLQSARSRQLDPQVGERTLERIFVDLQSGQKVSALVWGSGEPQAAFIHGKGQNAHTWDSVLLRLGWAAVAVDLPGHGRSDWREDHEYGHLENAEAVAEVLQSCSVDAEVVVGMSLGGGTLVRLCAAHPELVRRAVIIDTTPGREGKVALTAGGVGAEALLRGSTEFDTFDDLLEVVAATASGRPRDSRTAVLNNARPLEDGRWAWRWDPGRPATTRPDNYRAMLWSELEGIKVPLMLVRGADSAHVDKQDVDELIRRQPTARVETVKGAGHSIQGDRPAELAELIADFVAST